MRTKTAPRSAHFQATVSVADLKRFAQGWIGDGQYRQLSPKTQETRRAILDRFFWWLEREGAHECGAAEVKGFLQYLTVAHKEPCGRFGISTLKTPLGTRSVKDCYSILRTFFRWIVAEGYLRETPMDGLRPPIHRPDQVQPFTEEQVCQLLQAAKKGRHPLRDEALLLFMVDTGVRASELCGLKLSDIDIVARKALVLGKGNKHRAVYFGRDTGRILWRYVRETGIEGNDALFWSQRKLGFTTSGLRQLIERLGGAAKIEATRCSPHTLRHTFAVMFLRAGGGVFTLREMLGHTDLAMTNRYVSLAQADVQNQHQLFSPVERLKGRK